PRECSNGSLYLTWILVSFSVVEIFLKHYYYMKQERSNFIFFSESAQHITYSLLENQRKSLFHAISVTDGHFFSSQLHLNNVSMNIPSRRIPIFFFEKHIFPNSRTLL